MESIRQQAWQSSQLFENALPTVQQAQRCRRVLVCLNGSIQKGSGVRIAKAMSDYGWQVEMLPRVLEPKSLQEDCRMLLECCRQGMPELLLFEASHMIAHDADTYLAMKKEVLALLPAAHFLGVLVDVDGNTENKIIEKFGAFFDKLVSYGIPPAEMASHPQFSGKIMRAWPPVFGEGIGSVSKPLESVPLFDGIFHASNWSRLLWYVALRHYDCNINWKLNVFSYHNEVYKRSPLEYYRDYIKGLEEATCCLSLSALSADSPVTDRGVEPEGIMTGRAMETVLSGSLLIQEYSPNTRRFLLPGEHYLEFHTFAELRAILKFIVEHKEEAEAVRQRGFAFAQARYGPDKLVGYIDKFVFYSDDAS
ncbi:MAG: glycosyltransferase family 1 protein [Magnetococcales bacterium]|nr:glycosyltransferase family 1 protein [Magnetococcales bacterium]